MFARSDSRRSLSANIGEIEKRLRLLEQRLDRASGRASAGAVETGEHVKDAIASALAGVIDQFRSGGMSGEAVKIGNEAAKLGGEAVRRLSKELRIVRLSCSQLQLA